MPLDHSSRIDEKPLVGTCATIKGPVLDQFSDLYFLTWIPLEQPGIKKNPLDPHETVGLALCLQHLAKMLSFLLKLMFFCTFHIIGKEQRQDATRWSQRLE